MGIQERKQREKERRKQQIMVAAKRVFVERGYGKTTMESIAKEAELSAGTLYLYFKSKSELWATLCVRVLQYLLMRLDHVISQPDSMQQNKMAELKAVLLDAYEFDPMIFKNLFNLQTSAIIEDLSPELTFEIKELGQQSLDRIASVVQQGINSGIFLDRRPGDIADIVWSLFSGVILWKSDRDGSEHKDAKLQATLETAFEILEKGISTQREGAA